MATRKSKKMLSGLKKKGFIKSENDHHKLILFINGKKTSIFTKISHGIKEYGDHLLSQVQKQVRLESKGELLDLIDCPMSYNDYIQHLNDSNSL